MGKRICKGCNTPLESTSEYCPKCGMLQKKKNVFLFFLLMVVLFAIVLELLFPLFGYLVNSSIFSGKYGRSAIMEMLLVLFILIVMIISGNSYVFTEKKAGFFRSILIGLPMFIFSSIIALSSLPDLFTNFNFMNLVSLVVFCISVGLAEEFLCIGWLQNEFIERFGSTTKGIMLSLVLSSLVFGFMHITNAFTTPQGILTTLVQVAQALTSGFLLGAVYYKSKNIWAGAFLHGFFDFSLMLGEVNVIKDCVNSEATDMMILSAVASAFLMLFYVFSGIIALSSNYGKPVFKNSKKVKIVGIIGAILSIILFMASNVVGSMFVKNQEMICYEYTEYETEYDYDVVTSKRNMYEFGTTEYSYKLLFEDDKLTLYNGSNSVDLEFKGTLIDYVVVDNIDYVDIIVEVYDGEYIIYHTSLDSEDYDNTEKYLKEVKDSFKRVDVPELTDIGYVVFDDKEVYYPYVVSEIGDEFLIDRDGVIYIIKRA